MTVRPPSVLRLENRRSICSGHKRSQHSFVPSSPMHYTSPDVHLSSDRASYSSPRSYLSPTPPRAAFTQLPGGERNPHVELVDPPPPNQLAPEPARTTGGQLYTTPLSTGTRMWRALSSWAARTCAQGGEATRPPCTSPRGAATSAWSASCWTMAPTSRPATPRETPLRCVDVCV